jgi:hypothetical protein
MPIDWNLVIQVLIPIITLFLGLFLNKWAEDRPKLITYLSQTFAMRSKTPDGIDLNVHTHSIVVRNAGRRSATNLRIGHIVLPAFQILPSVDYTISQLPDGTKEIIIPRLVPKEQIIINYLYFPPLLWSQINTYTKSDEGFAKVVNMILSPQYSKRIRTLSAGIAITGLLSLGYLIALLVKWIIHLAKL